MATALSTSIVTPHALSALELQVTSTQTARAVADARRRLQRDLHDGTQQRLIALRIRLMLAAEAAVCEPQSTGKLLAELAEEVQQALDELRLVSHGGVPPAPARGGLARALRAVAHNLQIDVRLHMPATGRYAAKVESAVYFTCVEALQNAAKHAGGTATVTVHLREHSESLHFAVYDTGRGFDASDRQIVGGLFNMRERIAGVGGELEIRSSPASGTAIVGSVPVRVNA